MVDTPQHPSRSEIERENTRLRQRVADLERLAHLAEGSGALHGSLDLATVMEGAARLCLPAVADWSAVLLRPSGRTAGELAVAHTNPALAVLVRALFPEDTSRHPVLAPVESLNRGEAVMVTAVTDAVLSTAVRDPAQRAVLHELSPRTWVVAPLVIGRRTVGSLVLAMAGSGRAHHPDDRDLIVNLAARIAAALDHARLFAEARRELARSDEAGRARDELLATVSHQLRTPLNSVLGWTRLLRTDRVAEDRRTEALEAVERNARALARLVEDLGDASRIAAGKVRLHVRRVVPMEVVEAAMDAVRPDAEARKVRIQAVLDPSAGPVAGDPDRLQQVVWNLLNNALRATPDGGRILVRLLRAESHVELSVADQGPGISADQLGQAFDTGWGTGDEAAHGGPDFGLAIARDLVELHGGTLTVSSAGVGSGKTFSVRLPLSPAREDSIHPPPVHPTAADASVAFEVPHGLDGLRVLVVDDDPEARALLVAVLTGCGMEVLTARSAREAIAVVRRARPAVLVSDIGMPAEDGYSLVRRVRALPPEQGGQTPALALTAYARVEDRTRALLSGFQMHLPKPVDPAELVVVIANLAGRISP